MIKKRQQNFEEKMNIEQFKLEHVNNINDNKKGNKKEKEKCCQ